MSTRGSRLLKLLGIQTPQPSRRNVLPSKRAVRTARYETEDDMSFTPSESGLLSENWVSTTNGTQKVKAWLFNSEAKGDAIQEAEVLDCQPDSLSIDEAAVTISPVGPQVEQNNIQINHIINNSKISDASFKSVAARASTTSHQPCDNDLSLTKEETPKLSKEVVAQETTSNTPNYFNVSIQQETPKSVLLPVGPQVQQTNIEINNNGISDASSLLVAARAPTTSHQPCDFNVSLNKEETPKPLKEVTALETTSNTPSYFNVSTRQETPKSVLLPVGPQVQQTNIEINNNGISDSSSSLLVAARAPTTSHQPCDFNVSLNKEETPKPLKEVTAQETTSNTPSYFNVSTRQETPKSVLLPVGPQVQQTNIEINNNGISDASSLLVAARAPTTSHQPCDFNVSSTNEETPKSSKEVTAQETTSNTPSYSNVSIQEHSQKSVQEVADDHLMHSNFITPEEVPCKIQKRNCPLVLVTPVDTPNPVREGLTVRKNLFAEQDTLILPLDGFDDQEFVLLDQLDNGIDVQEFVVEGGQLMTVDAVPDVPDSTVNNPNQAVAAPALLEDGVPDNADNYPNQPVAPTGQKRKRVNVPNNEPASRKRKVNTMKWKASQAKLAYNSGLAHVSLRGKEIEARSVKDGCGPTCRQQCHLKISHDKRKSLFEKYWGLKDRSLQWYFLAKLVYVKEVKRRTVTSDDDGPYRKHTYEYSLPGDNGQRVIVCQKMLLDTFDISIKVVKTALSKNSPDKMGKHTSNRKRVSPLLLQSVINHIKSFPVVPSHYCRVDSQRKYLDENLNVSKMHRLYLMANDAQDQNTASLRQYRDIFNSHFNLAFFKPKKDQCAECADWNKLSNEEKANEEKASKFHLHQRNKEVVRALKKEDKELSRQENVTHKRVITMDMQKVLNCPKSEVCDFFYMCKLSVFNFTIYDCTVREGHLYGGDQTIGKKGANETSSSCNDYIEKCAAKGVTDLSVYSDSCGGQNKNQFLFTAYYIAAMKYKMKIVHRFLEKGHTQMECDSVHARVEKKVKQQEIIVPMDYYGSMQTAKVKKPPYNVIKLSQDKIYSFRKISEEHFSWGKIPISKLKELKIDCSLPGVARYKLSWDGPEKELQVFAPRVGRPFVWDRFLPKLAYRGLIPLPEKLKCHLSKMIKKGHISKATHVHFYETLMKIAPNAEHEEEEDDLVPLEMEPEPDVLNELMTNDYNNEEDDADPFLLEDDPLATPLVGPRDDDSDSDWGNTD